MTTVTADTTAIKVKLCLLNIALILSLGVIRPSISSFSLSSLSICSCFSFMFISMLSFWASVAVSRFSFKSLIFFSHLAISSLLASITISAGSPRALIIDWGRFSLTSPSELKKDDIFHPLGLISLLPS